MAHEAHAAEEGEHEEHHGSTRTFITVFILLCLFTSASIFTYTPLWHSMFTPQTGWAFMMAISCAKAMLVISFFMHMFWEANWKYVLTIPAAMMSVFLICMLVPDVGYRTRHYTEERDFNKAVPNMHAPHAEGDEAGEAGHTPGASH